MARGRFLSLAVLAVISLMGLVYYATVFIFLKQWLGLESSPGILNSLVFSFISFLGLVSFLTSVLTDPGAVPSSFAPDSENPQKTQGRQTKYCDKCCAYKPPRTHHCRVCRRCVLKMDHHCVWINNCVGYANYKPFFILILSVALGSIHSLVIFVCFVIKKDEDVGIHSPQLFYILFGSVLFLLSLSMITLLGWHIYLLCHNMSTIEYQAASRDMWLARKNGNKYRHPYDVGAYNNLITILGPNVLTWICPTARGHLNDGTHFPISND